jgi:surfactin synthase thioesterase subunit
VPTHRNEAIVRLGQAQSPRGHLICFPYAGGNARSYARWQGFMPPDLELWAIELPGRGGRRTEPFAIMIDDLVEELVRSFVGILDLPFIFFGHSMGATLSFLCARALRRHGLRQPDRLVVSARVPPHQTNPHALAPLMSDDQLINLMRGLGGTAPQILDEPELMALLLPILRADLRLLASHVFIPEPPLTCPITAINGSDDETNITVLREWSQHTANEFDLKVFNGGHFFIDEHPGQVIEYILRPQRTNIAERFVSPLAHSAD